MTEGIPDNFDSDHGMVCAAHNGPGEVERLLTQHDQVAEVAVVPGSGGDPGLIAYVVPASDAGGVKSPQTRVDEWQQIYDRLYAGAPFTELGDSFVGWNSSYDRRPIDLAEMRQWRDASVERVCELYPRRALEIGVGNGLLLSKIAPVCESYWATDLSPAAIDHLARHVATHHELVDRVVLRSQSADTIDGLPAGHFDTVIINSVVQLFPGPEYLAAVIDRAFSLLAPGGALFLGDIRDLRTLKYLHTAVALGRAAGTDPAAVASIAEKSRARAEELLVHPDFFLHLAVANPAVSAVDIQLKRGAYHNELSRHRYDVVLHKTPAAVVDLTECATFRYGADIANTSRLAAHLAVTELPLRVTDIPNVRLTGEVAAYRALADGDVVRARQLLTIPTATAVDPHSLAEIAAQTGNHFALAPSADHLDRFEAVFTRRRHRRVAIAGTYRRGIATARTLAEVPATTYRAAVFARILRAWLRDRLPEHLVPVQIISVAALPVRLDGTLDRLALPEPDR